MSLHVLSHQFVNDETSAYLIIILFSCLIGESFEFKFPSFGSWSTQRLDSPGCLHSMHNSTLEDMRNEKQVGQAIKPIEFGNKLLHM
ncbi:hypothetical protein M3Y95_00790700 [Aphelenchoides besseyi]|nr:hypothetical protein M3Y95_00790700 [Aphelenchoides besseyi]